MRRSGIPISLFILGQVSSVAILVLWIIWSAQAESNVGWLIQGILLMALIIIGMTVLFFYWTKSRNLDAERANFMSGVSHELLTPLASIRLYLETMMIRDLEDEKSEQFMELMLEESERLQSLISQILSASKLEKSKVKYAFEEKDLAVVIDDFIKNYKMMLTDVDLFVELDDDCFCMVDVPNFTMVLKNLVENGIRYSPSPATISISLKREDKKIHLVITDNGDGIHRTEIKKIFKLFYRASEKQTGTGLGLFIVWKVIRAHRGKVWAESKGPGLGTSQHIKLPALTD